MIPWRALFLLLATSVSLRGGPDDLFESFRPGWREQWEEKSFFSKPTTYDVETEGEHPVLHAHSVGGHRALLRRIRVDQPTEATLVWNWKIRAPLIANSREREKAGDDFAARVLVTFETALLPWRTRALTYVWAAHEPIGAIYPSPYAKNVGTIVLQSGSEKAGQWQTEQRDLLADYLAFFGERPTRISGVAVLVDTDNTGLEAEAWFQSLRLKSLPDPPQPESAAR